MFLAKNGAAGSPKNICYRSQIHK